MTTQRWLPSAEI